jgi:hypothetical protein
MRLKIDVMERKCKNLEFGREVNKALIILNLFICCCPHIIRQIVESTLQHVAVSLFVQVVVCLGGSIP